MGIHFFFEDEVVKLPFGDLFCPDQFLVPSEKLDTAGQLRGLASTKRRSRERKSDGPQPAFSRSWPTRVIRNSMHSSEVIFRSESSEKMIPAQARSAYDSLHRRMAHPPMKMGIRRTGVRRFYDY